MKDHEKLELNTRNSTNFHAMLLSSK